MKAVILAGGLGSRMGLQTKNRPKPMVEVGGRPLLWHLMQLCSAQGVSDFIIALGHKGDRIKDYFLRYRAFQGDFSIDLRSEKIEFHCQEMPDWHLHLVDTGLGTMTGGRLKRLHSWLREERHFLMTYGDGLADIDLRALEQFHVQHGRLATITAVRIPERFGRLSLRGDTVMMFEEKPDNDRPWINGGFFVLSPKVLDYIEDDAMVWEREPLQRLCAEGQLRAFRHEGFWSGLDTPNDVSYLETLWSSGQAPWLIGKTKEKGCSAK